METKFYKKIASPASGKTYGAIQYMVDNIRHHNKRYVVAAISVDLCNQIMSDIPEDINVSCIINETGVRGLVKDRYVDAIKSKEDDILIITHTNLLNCYDSYTADGWDIIVDELPTIHNCVYLKIPDLRGDTIADWLTVVNEVDGKSGYAEMELRYGFDQKLENYLESAESIREDESYINPKSLLGLKGVLNGTSRVLRKQSTDEKGNTLVEYAFNVMCDPAKLFNGFGEVIFLCAEFDKQLTGMLLTHKFGVVVEDKTDIKLRATEYKEPARIKIYPLIKAPKIYSRKLSESWYCKNTKNKFDKHSNPEEGQVEFFEHLVDVAGSIVGDEGYIYTVNKFRNEMIADGKYPFLQESDKVKSLRYNPHGLNNYMRYNVALGLFCCNPRPIQRTLLRNLDKELGMEEGTFERAYEVTAMTDPIFQLVTRTKIRRFDLLEDIICIVPDYRSVDYLTSTWFKGAVVDWSYAVEVIERKGGAPKKFRSLLNMSEGEYCKFKRQCKKWGVTPKSLRTDCDVDYKLVEDWIVEERSKEKTKNKVHTRGSR